MADATRVDIFNVSEPAKETLFTTFDHVVPDIFAALRDDATGEVDVYNTKVRHSTLAERDLFDNYRIEYFENPLVHFLVEHVVGELTSFHFEGNPEEVEKVQLAWDNMGIDAQLTIVTRQWALYGNGFGDKIKKGKELQQFRDFDASRVTIDRDEETGDEVFKFNGEDLKRENTLVMRLLEFSDTPYGMSIIRACIKALQGMGNLSDDVPAAIKRLAYAEKVLKLDLDGVEVNKKADVIKRAKERFAKYDSATAQVTAMDKRHDLKYVGSEGGGTQRIIPLMGVIEPVLAFVLMNFYMAIGHVMQTGANKALLEAQEQRARRAIAPLKRIYARTIERELIADILGIEIDFKGKKPLTEPIPVRVVHDRTPDEILADRKLLLQEYVSGMIPREYAWVRAGHVIPKEWQEGGTYYYDTPLGQQKESGPATGSATKPDSDGGAGRSGKGGSSEKKSKTPSNFSEAAPEALGLQAIVSMKAGGEGE